MEHPAAVDPLGAYAKNGRTIGDILYVKLLSSMYEICYHSEDFIHHFPIRGFLRDVRVGRILYCCHSAQAVP